MLDNKQFTVAFLLCVLAAVCCACTRGRVGPDHPVRVYHRPYDEVWEAVQWVLLEDLGFVDRKMKKNRGYLETDWVHSFDTTGQRRWKFEALLKKNKDAVTVALVKTVQLKDPVSKKVRHYNQKENNEPVGPHAGWSSQKNAGRDLEDVYRRIDLRLEQKQP